MKIDYPVANSYFPKRSSIVGEEEMEDLITKLFEIREELDINNPNRNHYRAQLGELRFGQVNEAKSIEYFEEQLNKKVKIKRK